MGAISGELLFGLQEEGKLQMPDDKIEVNVDGTVRVEVDHYVMQNGLLVHKRTTINSKIGKILSGFQYLKPEISDQSDPDSLLRPQVSWEQNNIREGCHVIGMLLDSARMANHMDAVRNALIVLIQNSVGEWETRYFPEQNIPEKTWDEGKSLLFGEHIS